MTAFRAAYSDWKVVKTRSCVQVVFEVPIELADEAYKVLGGMPQPSKSVWCGVARLNEKTKEDADKDGDARLPSDLDDHAGGVRPAVATPTLTTPTPPPPTVPRNTAGEAERRDWSALSYSTRAGIRCNEPIFRAFLREICGKPDARSADGAATAIRELCEVESRGDIRKGTEAEKKWLEIESWFDAWKTKERATA